MWKQARHLVLGMALAAAGQASAAPVVWTDWTGVNASSVFGAIGANSVTYTGPYSFAQTGGLTTNYWTEGSPAPYTGNPVIDNAPTPGEMVALDGSGTHTITFGSAILNPVLAIVSMGRTTLPVSYDFDQDFDILSNGVGYFSGGVAGTISEDDATDTLTGSEAHAAIQFNGLLTSISWTSSPDEYWHGITVGEVQTVPAPAGIALLGLGLILLSRRR